MTAHTPLVVIGYAPHSNIVDPEILADFADFPVGMTMTVEETKACLDRGVLPPGLVIYAKGGRPGVVRGVYGKQFVEVLV
jgi:hypothetical protein